MSLLSLRARIVRFTRSALAWWILIACAASSASASPEDRLTLADGSVLTVDAITYAGFDKVEYRKGSSLGSQPSHNVVEIDYGDAPGFLRLSRERRSAKDFKNAVNLMKAALAAPGVRAWIQSDGAFELGETLREWGRRDPSRYAQAVEAYEGALSDPKARVRPEALLGRALANAGAGNLDAALADLATLRSEAARNEYGTAITLRADYERMLLLLDGGRPEARQAVYELEASATREAGNKALGDATRRYATEIKAQVRLARGRLQITDGHADQAASAFDAIRNDPQEPRSARAAAEVAYGFALRAQAKRKEAQYAFARVRVLFASERESAAEATYWLGITCEELGAAEPRGDALAQEYFRECVERLDGTRYSEKARSKLH